MTSHLCSSRVTHMNESCHTYERAMSHIWTSHVTHMNESCHTYERVMSHIWASHVTHTNESCHTYERVMSDMGWLRSVGSIKLQVSFAEYSPFLRSLLQKRPTMLSILLIETTRYVGSVSCWWWLKEVPPMIVGDMVHIHGMPRSHGISLTYVTLLWDAYRVMSHTSTRSHVNEACHEYARVIQGGEDSQDARSRRSFSAKEPLLVWLFCGKWPVKIRRPMSLRHPVSHVYSSGLIVVLMIAPHTRMSYLNEAWHEYERVMSHEYCCSLSVVLMIEGVSTPMWTSHVPCEWDMSWIWTSHVPCVLL